MVVGKGYTDEILTEAEVRDLVAEALTRADLAGRRVLVIIPDGTRTAPVPLLFRLFHDLLSGQVAALDYLVALGTHPPMDDAALSRLVGGPVRDGWVGKSRIINHRWDLPETFITLGTLPATEVEELSEGHLSLDVPVRLNRLILDYDQLLVCGPVFPHEVVGFSGGNKYFVPGIAGPEIINVTHWLGALLTSMAIIGVADTPVRRMIDRAASFIPTPRLCFAMVMQGEALHGLYIGPMEEAWRAAVTLSGRLDIVYVERPFRQVLSVIPEMYDDLWTAAKGMYKVEPVVADGGEVIIYAPHITEVSYTHGRLLDEIGYHVRDYFLRQWDCFKGYPWGVLAHSTHLRGVGTCENDVESPRIRVTLATGIPRERCERVGLGYLDPATVDPEDWADREDEGILLVRRAGEVLYRMGHKSTTQCDIGLIGLAVMGQNLALNMERNGFQVAVYNRTAARTQEFMEGQAVGKDIHAGYTIEEFVGLLRRPRAIMLMVKAGAPVDAMIEQLLPHLEPGDLIVDGGNSFFKDTERRAEALADKGLLYIGTGVSGGEYGALHGPSIMPGGQPDAYERVRPILEAIAAKVNGEPCVTYIGPRGAGHYVKMVHNGIEYGDMQLIAESYDILSRAGGLSAAELHQVFAEWNRGELESYLIEITADIFARVDEGTGKPLVELILDEAKQKGTGKWTSQDALDLGAPTPTINAAVESRIISAYKEERVAASKVLAGPSATYEGDREALVQDVRRALFAAKICSYAQGMALLRAASHEYGYNLDLAAIARIWRGGCIIRAGFLNDVSAAFQRDPELPNLLLDPYFKEAVEGRQGALRRVIQTSVGLGIPCLAFSASLAYYDAYRTARLPANLTQAQRDYFGAHTYRRIDKEGVFHTEWTK